MVMLMSLLNTAACLLATDASNSGTLSAHNAGTTGTQQTPDMTNSMHKIYNELNHTSKSTEVENMIQKYHLWKK